MADRAEKEAELWERAEQAARDPYIEDKQEVLRHIEGLPVQFSTTECCATTFNRSGDWVTAR